MNYKMENFVNSEIYKKYFNKNSNEIGITSELYDNKKLIVSLTSYEKRINIVPLAVESLLRQTLKPNKIILWLSYECPINEILEKQKERGLEIMRCFDMKSYKKLIPTLNLYPDDIIITCDDDIIYNENTIKKLYNSYLKDKNAIHCCNCYLPKDCCFLRFDKWWKNYNKQHSFLMPTTGAGTLYPPNSLHSDVLDYKIALKLCPISDDIFIYVMCLMKKTNVIYVDNGKFLEIEHFGETLWSKNIKGEYNKSLKRIHDYYLEKEIEIFPNNSRYQY